MRVDIVTALDEISPADWNALVPSQHPFVCHEFLATLERHHCVGAAHGWQPCHLVLHDDNGRLVAAMPQYLKNHSRGEFVFDQAWADAFEQHGLPYYPKLVTAVPFTPVPGPRLLIAPGEDSDTTTRALLAASLQLCERNRIGSRHWLFPGDSDRQRLADAGMLLRKHWRFVWRNRGYEDFDDFLADFTAAKRKKIRRERRRVAEQGLHMRVVHGSEADTALWQQIYPLYASTYYLRGQSPYLTREFFEDLCRQTGDNVVLFLACVQDHPVACAITLRDEHSLYGRHWGCADDYHSLHFETCYYRPLEYCIARGIEHFDPGTQGEHKLSRGFLPEASWSAHWIAHTGFRAAIADFLAREQAAVDEHLAVLAQHSPFRNGAAD